MTRKAIKKAIALIKEAEETISNKTYIDIIIKEVSPSGHSGRIYIPPEYIGKKAIIIIENNMENKR